MSWDGAGFTSASGYNGAVRPETLPSDRQPSFARRAGTPPRPPAGPWCARNLFGHGLAWLFDAIDPGARQIDL